MFDSSEKIHKGFHTFFSGDMAISEWTSFIYTGQDMQYERESFLIMKLQQFFVKVNTVCELSVLNISKLTGDNSLS